MLVEDGRDLRIIDIELIPLPTAVVGFGLHKKRMRSHGL